MMVTYLASFSHDGTITDSEWEWLAKLLAAIPALSRGLIYTPARTHDPYLDDGRPPALVLQLDFAELATLEAALAADGPLQALAPPDALPSLRGATVTQQAMLARTFPVPDAGASAAAKQIKSFRFFVPGG